jgi:hypothetical protein
MSRNSNQNLVSKLMENFCDSEELILNSVEPVTEALLNSVSFDFC